jgi:hypothetical protein
MNKCYVKLLSGDVHSIDVFEGYRISQLKNELIDINFVDISDYPDLNRIIVLDEESGPMSDRDTINTGKIYNIFIKHKPVYITLKFTKNRINGGIFSLHDEKGQFISVCGYNCEKDMEIMSDVYIDTLYVDPLYTKPCKKIRNDLWFSDDYNTNWNKNEEKESDQNEPTDYYKLSNHKVLEIFIERFVKNFCRGIDMIVSL